MTHININTTPDNFLTVKHFVNGIERLHELVNIHVAEANGDKFRQALLTVGQEGMVLSPEWDRAMPPVVFPSPVPFTQHIFLGLVFMYINNYERAYDLLEDYPDLLAITDAKNRLENNIPFSEEILNSFAATIRDDYTRNHNLAVLMHYSGLEFDFDDIRTAWLRSLEQAPTQELYAFSAFHYATLLTDAGQFSMAAELLEPVLGFDISEKGSNAVAALWSSNASRLSSVSHDSARMERIRDVMWRSLQYYEDQGLWTDAAFILMDASYLATVSQSYAEALGYIQRSVRFFRDGALEELAAQALIQKAKLLYSWGQNGNPQFYREALKACQEALKVFTRESAPYIFADIHHQMGLIYAEIPDEIRKKSVWAAVSISSFKEALAVYGKSGFPYEYGTICNSQGNAFMKYPLAIHSDNYEKALEWFRESLSVRPADLYPVERALTMLNFLEAGWNVNADNHPGLPVEMVAYASEIIALEVDESLKSEARVHLEQLKHITSGEPVHVSHV